MENLRHWVGGYVEGGITGHSPERFLNLCSGNGIALWNLKQEEGNCRFSMEVRDFRRIRPLVRKSGVRFRIHGKKGLPFFLRKNRSRAGFGAGIGLFFLLLYGLSLFIWDIQIQGNLRYSDETITDFLRGQEVSWGMPRASVDCQQLEKALRDYFPEIAWAAARVSGTRLLISVKENDAISAVPEKQEEPCDVVAARDGTVSSILVRQGVAMVRPGEQVEAGQVLISGTIPLYHDNGEIAAVRYVPADGDVFAVTRYDFSESFPRICLAEAETGRKKTGLYFQAGPWSFVLLLPGREGEQWTYLTETTQARIFSDFYLPLYWGKIRGKEVETYERFRSKTEMNETGAAIYQNFMKNLNEKGVQIIQNDVKILEGGSACRVEGRITALESITQIRKITDCKETENSKYECSGEHN